MNGAVSRTGSFRLGGKPASGRHVLGGANGQRVNGSRAMALPTTEDEGKLADLDPSTTRYICKYIYIYIIYRVYYLV